MEHGKEASAQPSIKRLRKTSRMSQLVQHGSHIYLAGQIPDDCSKPIGEQTAEVLKKVDALLAEVGLTKAAILFVQIWLQDISDFAGMNAVWDSWVDVDNPPARATCQAPLARPGARIEVLVTAASEPPA